MEIVFVTTEVAPYSRASEPSELADVSASLPKALRGLGHKVTVVSPLYRDVDPTARSLARRLSTLNVELRGKTYPCTLYDGRTTGGVDLLFLGNAELFGSRTASECTEELAVRGAIVLGSATAQLIAKREPPVDVLHAHGAGGALALSFAKAGPAAPSCVLSLYEGQDAIALDAEQAGAYAAQLASYGLAPSALAVGLAAADGVLVDSDSNLRGLLESSPLSAALSAKGQLLAGIVNGVDASHWNPLIDSHLSSRFDATYPGGKARCKASLQYMFGLGIQPEIPVFAAIGELSEARGGDLLARAAEAALRNEIQLLVLGTPGPAAEALTELSAHYPERLAVRTSHDDKERHLALGGSDFLVLPARKPIGLDIAIAAMRYGALPIVRPIGALADVIVDCDAQLDTGTGFVIPEATSSDLAATLQRATAAFARRPAFEQLRKRVMQQDLSWERSARRYEHLYKRIRQAQQPAA
ncbi:MAG TPA: glycogen/starch synthase [Polyangiales bacterium]|nr:glycogen/starch synthase [Polyangiales bacterium]